MVLISSPVMCVSSFLCLSSCSNMKSIMSIRIIRYEKSRILLNVASVYANDISTAAAGGCSALIYVIVCAYSANIRNMANA